MTRSGLPPSAPRITLGSGSPNSVRPGPMTGMPSHSPVALVFAAAGWLRGCRSGVRSPMTAMATWWPSPRRRGANSPVCNPYAVLCQGPMPCQRMRAMSCAARFDLGGNRPRHDGRAARRGLLGVQLILGLEDLRDRDARPGLHLHAAALQKVFLGADPDGVAGALHGDMDFDPPGVTVSDPDRFAVR